MIDTELSGRPRFQCHVLNIGDEELEFFCRDVLECIRSLYGDPSWAQDMSWSGHCVFQLSWFWSFQTGVFPK